MLRYPLLAIYGTYAVVCLWRAIASSGVDQFAHAVCCVPAVVILAIGWRQGEGQRETTKGVRE